MPFSSVLGASSVIRPGVCTSTTRPTVPFTGQLIFETDTTRLAVWTGSAWQYETAAAGPPGLVYITGASFTTATSFSLPNNTFSATYRNYKLIVNITAVTSDSDFTMRMRASGTDDSNTSYQYAFTGLRNDATASNSTSGSASSWVVGEQDSATVRYSLNFDVMQPQVTAITSVIGTYHFVDKANTFTAARTGAGFFTATTQFDSLSFISSVASSITGIYRVYGYTDS